MQVRSKSPRHLTCHCKPALSTCNQNQQTFEGHILRELKKHLIWDDAMYGLFHHEVVLANIHHCYVFAS